MLPSRKRQTTPPDASPAKRPATALPDAAPEPPAPNSPVSRGPAEWSSEFKTCANDCIRAFSILNKPEAFAKAIQDHETAIFRPALGMFGLLLVSITQFCTQNNLPLPENPMLNRFFAAAPSLAPVPIPSAAPAVTIPSAEPLATDPPPPVPRTYASVAVGTPATSETPPSDPKPSQTTRPKPKGLGLAPTRSAVPPIRLIVRPGPSPVMFEFPFAALFLKGPSEPFRLLSHALALNPATKDVKLLGVHQNRNKNLVVSLAPGTSDTGVTNVIPITRSTLTPRYPRGPGPTPIVDRDIPWSKLLVSSVPARTEPSAPVHSEADVHASFLTNPAVSALKLTRPPRWIRNPASISGAHSSFTFSFEDPDGSLARSLAKSSLFVFGVPVHLKRWVDKPLAKRKETRRRRMDA